jgi:multiple sugar transport system substrate-binding protein
MNKSRLAVLFTIVAVLSMVLASCATPTPQVVVQTQVVQVTSAPVVQTQVVVQTSAPVIQTQVVQVTAAPAAQAKPIVTWTQYDQGNVDPKSDERVGNDYMRKYIPIFNQAFAGKWTWDNQFTPWDRVKGKVVAAVQAKADVADVVQVGSFDFNVYYSNGTFQDLTDWAKQQSWYAEMDPSALASCTGPDGKLYCVPVSTQFYMVYAWKAMYPNGFPTTPDQWLTEGARLKKANKYAMTFFGSTAFDGEGAIRAVFMAISSFGGGYDDGKGHLALNTPQNIAAITWLREMVQKGYVPDIAFAGNFQEEEAFKDASAGALPTGFFGYRYLNPLTAPNGNKYSKGNENDFLDAVTAGDAVLEPFPAPEGQKPSGGIATTTFAIPVGAKNVDGAHDFLNWLMTAQQDAAFSIGPGGGLPTIKSAQADPAFQTVFYKEAATVAAASNFKTTFPTITDTTAAQKAIMNAVYTLIKQNPTADIAKTLQAAQDDYNKNVP